MGTQAYLVPFTGLKKVCWFWFGALGEPIVGCRGRGSSLCDSAKLKLGCGSNIGSWRVCARASSECALRGEKRSSIFGKGTGIALNCLLRAGCAGNEDEDRCRAWATGTQKLRELRDCCRVREFDWVQG